MYDYFFKLCTQILKKMKNYSEILNLLGEEGFDSVAPPIFQTSNFKFSSVNDFAEAIGNERENLIYSRGNNPTLKALEKKMAELENGHSAFLFASGMAAISTGIISYCKNGGKVVSVRNPYSWVKNLFINILPRFGVEVIWADSTNIQDFITQGTTLVYLESPLTFSFELQNLEVVAKMAKRVGAVTMIDNSYSTFFLQKPIDFGIDVVAYSMTKYYGGHSDNVGGALVFREKEMADAFFINEFLTFGGIMNPFAAWLMIRGLRTLPLRLDRISKSTKKIIAFLESHPAVEKVLYPGSISVEQKELKEKQMKDISGLFSVQFKTRDKNKISDFCNHSRLFQMAVSWGGHESLIIPAFILNNPAYNDGIIRFSIGLEDYNDLIAELDEILKYLL